ncbi:hypothetical protein NKG05_22475 [Oerskovia sp. M15]
MTTDPTRAGEPGSRPGGSVEFNVITAPGNYGWPYCVGNNVPYVDHDFATGASGAAFDCSAPKNTSPNNTGLVDLPPTIAAWQPYDGGSVPAFGTGASRPWAPWSTTTTPSSSRRPSSPSTTTASPCCTSGSVAGSRRPCSRRTGPRRASSRR